MLFIIGLMVVLFSASETVAIYLFYRTAKEYKEIQNPIQKVKINISSVASNTSQSAINELIKEHRLEK